MSVQSQSVSPSSSVNAEATSKEPAVLSSGRTVEKPYHRIRSCLGCRTRKIKCDRQKPCDGCQRVEADCVYPSGPGRAPKKPRRAIDKRVIDRLADLEALVRRLEDTDKNVKLGRGSSVTGGLSADSTRQLEHESSPPEQQFGRLVIDDTRSCYVSNILWASLGDEIEELRDLIYHEPASGDDDFDAATVASSAIDTPTFAGCNAAIMGFHALSQSLRAYHPGLSQSVALFETFKQNVAPVVHIFHMPTLNTFYWDAAASPESLGCNAEALLFAIYYSTVISMESQQCEELLGFSRAAAVKHYQFAVEQAMARADLLNTQSVVLIQAAVLFLSALRNEDASRTAWSMTALIFHIAQAMGLHRDGASFGLCPLEIEIRRRLWWHICLLDIRSSEYHGCEPIVDDSKFDTRMPLNINDSDLTLDMTEPPPEREGTTEMTFCLIRCEVMRVVWKTGYVPPGLRQSGQMAEASSLAGRAALAKDLQQRLEEQYLKHCDTSIPFFQACVTVARLIIARTWLVVYYPLRQKEGAEPVPGPIQDQLFSISVKVLELSCQLLTNPAFAPWTWHSKTHVQWHAVAFVLSEICSRPPSPDGDRAWEYAQTVYSRWKMKEHKGTLWRPIKRLMAKAQYVRETQKSKSSAVKSHWRVDGMTTAIPKGCTESTASGNPSLEGGSNPATVKEITADFWALPTESFDSCLESLSRTDLMAPALEYAYQVGTDFNLTDFTVSPMDMVFEMNEFTP
ncbi:Bikaverin cluster transcription factor bik5 [Beauveria bassiana]|nr:Bikaverin cluster transcription factor bik5 [Beauveria bassiana]KAH8709429.1 Bikaverin cluster transcription factor bik5 [Beauveria bassiana]